MPSAKTPKPDSAAMGHPPENNSQPSREASGQNTDKERTTSQCTNFSGVERSQKLRSKTPAPSITGSVRLQRSGLRREKTLPQEQLNSHRTSNADDNFFETQPPEDEESDLELDDEVVPFVLPGEEMSIQSSGLLTSTVEDEDDVNGYDTDLEIDDHEWLNPTEEYDQSGIKDYIRECNRLGVIPVSYFKRHIQDRAFVMKHHGLGPLGAKAISKPLENNTVIESLDLEGNDIGGEGVHFLCKTMKENLYITDVNLAENGLGSEGARVLCTALREHTTIKELDLSGNHFRDTDGEHFHTMLINNSTLKQLVLKHNNFEFSAAKWIRDALAENENLRILDLSWNKIRLKGAVYIAEMIKENYGLKYLNLMMNGLGDEGAAAIGAALKHNQCLVELNIMANRISQEGAVQVAKGLLVNDVLETIRIGRNPIGANGAFALLSAIGKNENSTLNLLDMTNVIVMDEFETLHEKVNDQREFYKLKVIHGGVYYANKIHYSEVDPLDEFENDPMTKLKRYAEKNKLRLVDLFRQFDKDNSWSVDRDEFIMGVKSTGIDMSEAEIDKLIKMLDQDGDGEIDYGELVYGDNMNRAKLRELLKANEEKIEKEEVRRKREEEGFQFDDDDDFSKPSSPIKIKRS